MNAFSNEELLSIYLKFQDTYIKNDYKNFSRMITDDFSLTFKTNMQGIGESSSTFTSQPLIAGMKGMRSKPSPMRPSTSSNSYVESKEAGKFCTKSHLHLDSLDWGKMWRKAETRTTCFSEINGKYLATKQEISIIITPL